MPRSFKITPMEDAVRLDDRRRGTVTLKVMNTTGRIVTGRVSVKADQGAQSRWFEARAARFMGKREP